MTPQDLLSRIIDLTPGFAAWLDDPGNLFRHVDGSFTLHGVFVGLTDFFRERHGMLATDRLAAIGAFVSECMASPGTVIDNAAATCFVENIAGEACGDDLKPYLSGEARDYYRAWCGGD